MQTRRTVFFVYRAGVRKWDGSGWDRVGSFNMRARNIAPLLNADEYDHRFIRRDRFRNTTVRKADIAIFIKCLPVPAVCTVVTDVVDAFHLLTRDHNRIRRHSQIILFPNHNSYETYCFLFADRQCYVIPHHWDPDKVYPTNNTSAVALLYVGLNHHKNVPKYIQADRSVIKVYESGYSTMEPTIRRCNVHVNIRSPESAEYKFKPCTKLTFCAASESVLITLREPSIMELDCMHDYPYFMDNATQAEFERVLAIVRKTFQGPIWRRARSIMNTVKSQTSVNRIFQLYRSYIFDNLGAIAEG